MPRHSIAKHRKAAAAQRMRRMRQRRKAGCCHVLRIQCTHEQVLELAETPYLREADTEDTAKVNAAAQQLWNEMLRVTSLKNGSAYSDASIATRRTEK